MNTFFSTPSKILQNPLNVAQNWFNRLSYPRKFIVIAFIFAIPIFAFLPLIAQQGAEIDRYGYKPHDGAKYLRITQTLFTAVLDHQRLSNQYFNRQADIAEVDEVSAKIDAVFHEYDLLSARNNERDIEGSLTPDVQAIKSEWEAFKAEMPQMNQTQRNQRYDALIAQILSLIEKASKASYLAINPNFDTKYLSDSILIILPQNTLTLHKLFLLSQEAIENGSLSAADREQMIIWIAQTQENLEALNKNLENTRAYNNANAVETALYPAYQAYEAQLKIWTDTLRAQILEPEKITFSAQALEEVFEKTLQAQNETYLSSSTFLEANMQERINSLTARFYSAFGLALLSIVVAFAIGSNIMNSISRPITQLTEAAYRLSNGEMDVRVPVSNQDEVGIMAMPLNQMAQEIQSNQAALETRAKALATSAEVSRRISTILEPKPLIDEVVAQIQRAFNYYHTHIYLLDENNQELILAGGTGEAGKLLLARKHKISKGKGLVGQAAETNQLVLVSDTTSDPNWLPNDLLPETKSEIAVPISLGAQVLGVLDVQQNRANGLTHEDAELLQAIAYQVAVALSNAQTYSQAKQTAERESLINEISRKIQNTASVEQAVQVTARELGLALGVKNSRVVLSLSEDK